MKRFFAWLLAIALFLALLPTTVLPSDAAMGGFCGDNVAWSFDAGTKKLTITGTGAIYDYNYYEAP